MLVYVPERSTKLLNLSLSLSLSLSEFAYTEITPPRLIAEQQEEKYNVRYKSETVGNKNEWV